MSKPSSAPKVWIRELCYRLYPSVRRDSSQSNRKVTSKDMERFYRTILAGNEKKTSPSYLNLASVAIGSRACKELILYFDQHNGYQYFKGLDLSRNKLGDEGAQMLANFITNNTSLEYLNIASNAISRKGLFPLIQAIGLSSLKFINIGNAIGAADSGSKNRLSEEGGRALALALQQNTTLTHLYMNGVGTSGVSAFVGMGLWRDYKINAPLTHLDLGINYLDDQHLATLCDCMIKSEVQYLNLSCNPLRVWYAVDTGRVLSRYSEGEIDQKDNRMTDEISSGGTDVPGLSAIGAKTLIKLLDIQRSPLRKLNLSNSKISTQGSFFDLFCQALRHHTNLVSLCLDNNPLQNTGGHYMGVALASEHTSLQELSMMSCGLTDISSISFAIAVNSTLRTLKLNGNHIGDIGAVALSQGIAGNVRSFPAELYDRFNPELQGDAYLSALVRSSALGGKSLREQGLRDRFFTRVMYRQESRGICSLQHLTLSNCEIGDIGAAFLTEQSRINYTLQHLDLSYNLLSNDVGRVLIHFGGTANIKAKVEQQQDITNLYNPRLGLPSIPIITSNNIQTGSLQSNEQAFYQIGRTSRQSCGRSPFQSGKSSYNSKTSVENTFAKLLTPHSPTVPRSSLPNSTNSIHQQRRQKLLVIQTTEASSAVSSPKSSNNELPNTDYEQDPPGFEVFKFKLAQAMEGMDDLPALAEQHSVINVNDDDDNLVISSTSSLFQAPEQSTQVVLSGNSVNPAMEKHIQKLIWNARHMEHTNHLLTLRQKLYVWSFRFRDVVKHIDSITTHLHEQNLILLNKKERYSLNFSEAFQENEDRKTKQMKNQLEELMRTNELLEAQYQDCKEKIATCIRDGNIKKRELDQTIERNGHALKKHLLTQKERAEKEKIIADTAKRNRGFMQESEYVKTEDTPNKKEPITELTKEQGEAQKKALLQYKDLRESTKMLRGLQLNQLNKLESSIQSSYVLTLRQRGLELNNLKKLLTFAKPKEGSQPSSNQVAYLFDIPVSPRQLKGTRFINDMESTVQFIISSGLKPGATLYVALDEDITTPEFLNNWYECYRSDYLLNQYSPFGIASLPSTREEGLTLEDDFRHGFHTQSKKHRKAGHAKKGPAFSTSLPKNGKSGLAKIAADPSFILGPEAPFIGQDIPPNDPNPQPLPTVTCPVDSRYARHFLMPTVPRTKGCKRLDRTIFLEPDLPLSVLCERLATCLDIDSESITGFYYHTGDVPLRMWLDVVQTDEMLQELKEQEFERKQRRRKEQERAKEHEKAKIKKQQDIEAAEKKKRKASRRTGEERSKRRECYGVTGPRGIL